jgi:hypothetical protein
MTAIVVLSLLCFQMTSSHSTTPKLRTQQPLKVVTEEDGVAPSGHGLDPARGRSWRASFHYLHSPAPLPAALRPSDSALPFHIPVALCDTNEVHDDGEVRCAAATARGTCARSWQKNGECRVEASACTALRFVDSRLLLAYSKWERTKYTQSTDEIDDGAALMLLLLLLLLLENKSSRHLARQPCISSEVVIHRWVASSFALIREST